MFDKNEYTTEEIVKMYCASQNAEVPDAPFSKELIHEADRFACDNDYYFFPFDEIYKKPSVEDLAFFVGK